MQNLRKLSNFSISGSLFEKTNKQEVGMKNIDASKHNACKLQITVYTNKFKSPFLKYLLSAISTILKINIQTYF